MEHRIKMGQRELIIFQRCKTEEADETTISWELLNTNENCLSILAPCKLMSTEFNYQNHDNFMIPSKKPTPLASTCSRLTIQTVE